MKMILVPLLAAAAVLSACGTTGYSDPSASPNTWSQQRQCDLGGGYWNRTADVCEAPLRW